MRPAYLAGQRYDAYDGHGWSTTVDDTFQEVGLDGKRYSPRMSFATGQGVHLSPEVSTRPLSGRGRADRHPAQGEPPFHARHVPRRPTAARTSSSPGPAQDQAFSLARMPAEISRSTCSAWAHCSATASSHLRLLMAAPMADSPLPDRPGPRRRDPGRAGCPLDQVPRRPLGRRSGWPRADALRVTGQIPDLRRRRGRLQPGRGHPRRRLHGHRADQHRQRGRAAGGGDRLPVLGQRSLPGAAGNGHRAHP